MPVRSALAGAALSVLAVPPRSPSARTCSIWCNTPRLYGQRWDVAIDLQFGTYHAAAGPAAARQGCPASPAGRPGTTAIVAIGGHVVPAIGLTPGKGPLLSPTLLSGRPPRTGNEIVLGTSTLRQIGRHVGQMVTVTINGHRLTDRIVGQAVFPNFGQGGFTPTDLGQGAETTAAVLQPQRLADGAGLRLRAAAFHARPAPGRRHRQLPAVHGPFLPTVQQSTCVVTDQRPNGITNYASIDGTPEVLAASSPCSASPCSGSSPWCPGGAGAGTSPS